MVWAHPETVIRDDQEGRQFWIVAPENICRFVCALVLFCCKRAAKWNTTMVGTSFINGPRPLSGPPAIQSRFRGRSTMRRRVNLDVYRDAFRRSETLFRRFRINIRQSSASRSGPREAGNPKWPFFGMATLRLHFRCGR